MSTEDVIDRFCGTEVFYPEVLDLRELVDHVLAENGHPVRLSRYALVFAMHQGHQFPFFEISSWALDLMRAHPWLVEPFVCWEPYENRISPWRDSLSADDRARIVTRVAQTLGLQREDAALRAWERKEPHEFALVRPQLARLRGEWDTPGLDLEKTWRQVLAGLKRCSPHAREVGIRAVGGGTRLGPDLGYAPAEYHEAQAVLEMAMELPAAAEEFRARRFEFSRELDYLRDYYEGAARQGQAMLLYLT